MKEKTLKDAKVDKKALKKLTKQVRVTEENKEVKKFIVILLIVVVLVVGVYFFTRAFVTKDLNKGDDTKEVVFDYNKTILGALLNRPYDEYYVLVYNSKDLKANYYSSFISSYKNKENSLKIYFADLNDSMNKKFYNKDKSNKNAKSVDELSVGDLTLIKVSNKNIVKYIENSDLIKQELGL